MSSFAIGWYLVLMLLVIGYALLDGFDLGVGILHLLAPNERHRRIHLNAIGPVWDGNEVWLVTAGGALFAGFPEVYATLASGFYLPFMLLLFALIFRACSIEFRSKHPSRLWRQIWDLLFSLASGAIALALGMVLGHLIQGVPLDEHGQLVRSHFSFLQPYPLLIGIMTIALFAMHGCIYLLMKTEEPEQGCVRRWIYPCIISFLLCYAISSCVTLLYLPHMAEPFKQHPLLITLPLLGMVAIANVPRQIYYKREGRAFLSSCLSIVALMSLFAVGQFPYLVRSNLPLPSQSLTLANAASSQLSFSILLTFVAIGIPFVLSYTLAVYWIFSGKVQLDEASY